MFWVYILRSTADGSYYCGHTDDLNRRLTEHNRAYLSGGRTTKRLAGTWQVVWSERAPTRSAAMQLERRIKKRGVARFLETKSLERNGQSPADGGINQ